MDNTRVLNDYLILVNHLAISLCDCIGFNKIIDLAHFANFLEITSLIGIALVNFFSFNIFCLFLIGLERVNGLNFDGFKSLTRFTQKIQLILALTMSTDI